MKSIISTTLVVAGMVMAGPASAAMFSFNVTNFGTNETAAQSALSAWQAGQKVFATETFESFDSYPDDGASGAARDPNTIVGEFLAGGENGTGGACVPESGESTCDTTIVKNEDEFGRNITADGDNWLDSNDAQETMWSISADTLPGKQFNRLAFFLIDAADVGATVRVSRSGGGADSFVLDDLGNGNIQFITGHFTEKVTSAELIVANNESTSDGWGIDDASVAVPTPGTLALFGLGLLGLGAAARRCRS